MSDRMKNLMPMTILKYMFLLYCITFLGIMPLCLYKTRFSLYYLKPHLKTLINTTKVENLINAHKAQLYLNKTDLNLTKFKIAVNSTDRTTGRLDLVISIVSMNRKKMSSNDPQYLTQSVAKFLSLLQENNHGNFTQYVKMFICNVDADPAMFTEVEHLKKYVTVMTRFKVKHTSSVHILEKEKQDYVYCLQTALKQKPRYMLLVQDDALPEKNFFGVLKHTIERHLDKKLYHGEFYPSQNDTGFVKFYHPERLLGYLAIDPERLSELFGSSLICGALITALLFCLQKIPSNYTRSIWIILNVYFMLVFLGVGRANINTWRNLFSPYLHSYSPAPSCCLPAVLYPANTVHHVIHYLNHTTCKKGYALDTALDEIPRYKKLKTYIVQPSTFKHIGMYSSLHKDPVDPSIV